MNDPLGVDAGSLGSLESMGLTNEYKDIPDQSLDAIADRVNPNQVASGVTRGIQQLGSDKVYSDGGNQQIIVEDTNEPRVMMGNHATFGEGFFVSKDGTNVKTNTNPANLIFNSSQNVFKIVSSGTVTLPAIAAGNLTSISVTHNLGYTPAFLAFQSSGSTYFQLPFASVTAAGAIAVAIYALTDITTITFSLQATTASTGGGPVTIKYYLLQETAT